MKRFNTCGYSQGSTTQGGFSSISSVRFASTPVAAGKVTIGGALTVSATTSPSNATLSYQWLRAGSPIASATGSSYTPISSDIGYDITCAVTASKSGRSSISVSNAVSYSLEQFSGMKYSYRNAAGAEGSFGSLTDYSSNGRTLSVSATGTAQPKGFSRNWAHNGNPVLGFYHGASQYAKDTAGDALSYVAFMHQPGGSLVWRGQILEGTGLVQLLGNWNLGTSNQNAFSLAWDSTNYRIEFYKTSTNAGGTVHINYNTGKNTIKPGDCVEVSLLHNANQTWSITVTREARTPSDVRTTYSGSGTSSAKASTGSATYGLTMCARGDLAAGFASAKLQNAIVFSTNTSSSADMADWRAYCQNKFNFNFLTFDSNVRSSFTTSSLSDGTHWATGSLGGHNLVGTQGRTLEQLCVTSMSLTGTVKVGVVGDSRLQGTDATLGLNDARSIIQFGSGSFTFTRSPVGPVNDGSGGVAKDHFARSGYVTRTNTGQTGHSQRTTGATTIDNYVGSGKSYNDVGIWHWCIGVNDITGGYPVFHDYVDELARIWEYCLDTQPGISGVTPGFVLQNESITGVTATGARQYLLRARNREYHAMAAHIRNRTVVKIGNLNNESYNP